MTLLRRLKSKFDARYIKFWYYALNEKERWTNDDGRIIIIISLLLALFVLVQSLHCVTTILLLLAVT